MDSGVTLLDPSRTWIDSAGPRSGQDTMIYPDVIIEGRRPCSADCVVRSGCRIVDCRLGNGVRDQGPQRGAGQPVGNGCQRRPVRPPAAGFRAGTPTPRSGNFVELKKTHLGPGSKASHLSLPRRRRASGRAATSEPARSPATTTARTSTHGARRASSSAATRQLVAPVKVGKGAYVAAGTTVTEDVPAGALAIARGRARRTSRAGSPARAQAAKKKAAATRPPGSHLYICRHAAALYSPGEFASKGDSDHVRHRRLHRTQGPGRGPGRGLRRLEYRGYDSAGVAVVDEFGCDRDPPRRRASWPTSSGSSPTIPLGQATAWATRAGRPTAAPSEENAHPHRDGTGRLVVIHNGIIENYLELKHELEAKGHEFVTETDTEIVAHAIQEEMLERRRRRLRKPRRLPQGAAPAARASTPWWPCHADAPETLVAARLGSAAGGRASATASTSSPRTSRRS